MKQLSQQLLEAKWEDEANDLFDDFGNVIDISDLRITYQGAAITTVVRANYNTIEWWSGDPEDKHSARIIPDNNTSKIWMNKVLKEI